MTAYQPADPEPTVETKAYWDATAEGRLMIGHCRSCAEPHFYPRRRCPHCLGSETELVSSAGRGSVYAFSVMRRARTPYAIAYVRLDEGVTMMSNIVDCDLDSISIGMPVAVTFRASPAGLMVPMFAPA